MTTIVLNILLDGDIPVDKYEKDDDGKMCPLPTRDMELNEDNKAIAVTDHGYGPAASSETCGNCGMYNQTEEMLECIGDDSGEKGYCQMLKFCCMRENTCDDWVDGGPITSTNQDEYGEYL